MPKQQRNEKKSSKQSGSKKGMDNLKLRQKVEKMIAKFGSKNKKQEQLLQINQENVRRLEELLEKIPEEEGRSTQYVKEMKKIEKDRQRSMKEYKKEMKKEKRMRKQERNKQKKEKKLEKKEKKQERKLQKKMKEVRLENSRIEELPSLNDINLDDLNIIVDGWNITGCDKIARKCMRGKRGSGAIRMIDLLKAFVANSEYVKVNGGENVNVSIEFDGNGKDKVIEGVTVKYSGRNEIVDDKLVRELTVNAGDYRFGSDDDEKSDSLGVPMTDANNPNRSYLVITSDRELTLRLNEIGVTVMKSGCFYKKYLKQFGFSSEELDEEENKQKEKKERKEKQKKEKRERQPPREKKHWKKYIKKRFSDNSTSSGSSSSSTSPSDDDDDMSFDDISPDLE